MRKQLESLISEKTKANLMLKAFGLTKVPLLFATGASVSRIDDQSCVVKMPFLRINKNHWGSLYFGALAIGADACVGLLAAHKIQQSGAEISLVFKSFEAQFLKRAMGPTYFVCDQGDRIDQMIQKVISTKERVSEKITAQAITFNETVAQFELELSLKAKGNTST